MRRWTKARRAAARELWARKKRRERWERGRSGMPLVLKRQVFVSGPGVLRQGDARLLTVRRVVCQRRASGELIVTLYEAVPDDGYEVDWLSVAHCAPPIQWTVVVAGKRLVFDGRSYDLRYYSTVCEPVGLNLAIRGEMRGEVLSDAA